MKQRKIVISSNTAWNIHNFRSGLIRALISDGYQVTAFAPEDGYSPKVKDLGCGFVDLPMDTHGTNPGRDLLLLMRYIHHLRSEQPHAYLGYTVKPNVYGSLAAHLLRIPVINNIAGLGTTFVEKSIVTSIVRNLYKCGLYWSDRIFFQNDADQELFVRAGLARAGITDRVPGSGIDLAKYIPTHPASSRDQCFRFLLVSRMLRYKGICEYVEAARIVRQRFPNVRFQLLGFVDERNANGVSLEEIRTWEREEVIQYLGDTDDVPHFLADADCVVLPSYYREGVPRTLLEAAAMARPIITTDTIGCRDVVEDNVNGFLCTPKDANDLAEKMTRMLMLHPSRRIEMGWAGRRKVEIEFDERLVVQKYLDALGDIFRNEVHDRRLGKAVLASRSRLD